jgi:glycosyltransferase involved in cell wall biosynthesis
MKSLKILHVSGTFDSDSSTASAVYLHEYLKKIGYNSKLAFFTENKKYLKLTNSFSYNLIYKFKSLINNLFIKIIKKKKFFSFFNDNLNSNLIDIIKKFKPDILHIHWLPRSISLSELKKINIKIVWTIRDFWAFTGGCNVPYNCNKYFIQCTKCPHLILNFKKDISYYNFQSKKKIYKKLDNIYLTFPCTDFENIYKKSILRSIKKYSIIPNSFDSKNIYRIQTKTSKKFIITFGAQNLDQEWKGMNIVKKIIETTTDKDIEFIIFGQTENFFRFVSNKENVVYYKYINNKKDLRKILSKSNIFLFPSYYESFGKVILESLACGTPVIANNAFGAKDIITHKKDGYLVQKNNFNEYKKGINFFKSQDQQIILKNCINKSKEYSITKIGAMFEKIYLKL